MTDVPEIPTACGLVVVPMDGSTGGPAFANLLMRDGAVVGFALQTVRTLPHVQAAWRTPDGRVGCHHDYVPHEDDDPWTILGPWWAANGLDESAAPEGFAELVTDARAGIAVEADLDGVTRSLRIFAEGAVRGMPPSSAGWERDLATALCGMGAAFAAFLDTLDPDALDHVGRTVAACRSDPPPWSARGTVDRLSRAWEGLDATFVPGVPLRRAMTAHPGLPETLVRAWEGDPDTFAATMRGRDGTDVAVWALRSSGLDARGARLVLDADAAVARLADRPGMMALRGSADDREADPAVILGRHLRELPASWVPRTDTEWDAFAALVSLRADADLDRFARDGSDLRTEFGSGGRWEDFAERDARAAGRPWSQVPPACRDVSDMVRAFSAQVVAPLATRATPAERGATDDDVAVALLCHGLSLPRLLEASRAWHARRTGIEAVVATFPVPGAVPSLWPAGFPDAARSGRDIVVLTSTAQLVAEGTTGTAADGTEGLAHCVGGYEGRCLRGEVRVLSVKTPGPGAVRRSSTAAIRLRDGVPDVVQHRAARNAAPSDEDARALRLYVGDVVSGVLRIDVEGLAPLPCPDRRAAYDASIPGSVESVLAAWRPVLPRRLRRMGLGTLADAVARVRPPSFRGW